MRSSSRLKAAALLPRQREHLLGPHGGVEPEISVSGLNGAIRTWRIYPRTLPSELVYAEKLGADGLDDSSLDWLILTIDKPKTSLPAAALHLRPRPVQIGETVYLIGCPYSEQGCKQNVYVGRITSRSGDRFRYDIDPPVDLRGFSGAPCDRHAWTCCRRYDRMVRAENERRKVPGSRRRGCCFNLPAHRTAALGRRYGSFDTGVSDTQFPLVNYIRPRICRRRREGSGCELSRGIPVRM